MSVSMPAVQPSEIAKIAWIIFLADFLTHRQAELDRWTRAWLVPLVLMAAMAVHDKRAPDALFLDFLPVIEAQAEDGRNFVKKAVNWALRQIGKRNGRPHAEALAACRRLRASGPASARWIASDALRELTNPATVARIRRKTAGGSRLAAGG